MSRKTLKLDEEEFQILRDFERGEFESIQHFRAEKRQLEAAAREYQVLIPPEVREKANVAVGDFLEANVERGKITLTPKTVIDRDLDVSLQQMRGGKMSPAYSSAKQFVRALHRDARKLRSKKKS